MEDFIRFYADQRPLSWRQTRRLLRRIKRTIKRGEMPTWRDFHLLSRTRDPLRHRSTVKRWLIDQHRATKEHA